MSPIQRYDRTIEIDPKSATLCDNKSDVLEAQGKYNESIAAYDRAIKVSTKWATSWDNRGDASTCNEPKFANARSDAVADIKVLVARRDAA